MAEVFFHHLVMFASGKCIYGRQGKIYFPQSLHPKGSKLKGEVWIQKAEGRLADSQTEKEECNTRDLNLFHIVRKSCTSANGFTIHLTVPESGGIVDSSLFI